MAICDELVSFWHFTLYVDIQIEVGFIDFDGDGMEERGQRVQGEVSGSHYLASSG